MRGGPGSRSAVVVSGGVAHDFPATSAELAEVLHEAGFATTVTEDVEAALTGLAAGSPGSRPLVVLNLLRWTMRVERYAHLRERWSLSLSAAARAALSGHVRFGGGLLAVHGASICFDDWPQWRELLGGVWRWDRSSHPPLGAAVRVSVARDRHPVVAGVPDFDVVDEVYGFLDLADDVDGLMTSPHGGRDHPLLWARTVGAGRVVYDALGHHVPSYAVPEHREIVRRAAVWADGGSLTAGGRPSPWSAPAR
ncbi:ThuA domain-containing protein [Geodermatophilus sp. SYSU D00696]